LLESCTESRGKAERSGWRQHYNVSSSYFQASLYLFAVQQGNKFSCRQRYLCSCLIVVKQEVDRAPTCLQASCHFYACWHIHNRR
jgi:hypothetical protein